jgi:hypothetical protein
VKLGANLRSEHCPSYFVFLTRRCTDLVYWGTIQRRPFESHWPLFAPSPRFDPESTYTRPFGYIFTSPPPSRAAGCRRHQLVASLSSAFWPPFFLSPLAGPVCIAQFNFNITTAACRRKIRYSDSPPAPPSSLPSSEFLFYFSERRRPFDVSNSCFLPDHHVNKNGRSQGCLASPLERSLYNPKSTTIVFLAC